MTKDRIQGQLEEIRESMNTLSRIEEKLKQKKAKQEQEQTKQKIQEIQEREPEVYQLYKEVIDEEMENFDAEMFWHQGSQDKQMVFILATTPGQTAETVINEAIEEAEYRAKREQAHVRALQKFKIRFLKILNKQGDRNE